MSGRKLNRTNYNVNTRCHLARNSPQKSPVLLRKGPERAFGPVS
jgi:hypothetical protein